MDPDDVVERIKRKALAMELGEVSVGQQQTNLSLLETPRDLPEE